MIEDPDENLSRLSREELAARRRELEERIDRRHKALRKARATFDEIEDELSYDADELRQVVELIRKRSRNQVTEARLRDLPPMQLTESEFSWVTVALDIVRDERATFKDPRVDDMLVVAGDVLREVADYMRAGGTIEKVNKPKAANWAITEDEAVSNRYFTAGEARKALNEGGYGHGAQVEYVPDPTTYDPDAFKEHAQ